MTKERELLQSIDTKLSLLLDNTKPVRFSRAQLLKELGISWRKLYQVIDNNGLDIPKNREENGGNNPSYSMATFLKIKELLNK